jgi:ABC-type transport system involved in multi-copper enzyme maturation permease subunit
MNLYAQKGDKMLRTLIEKEFLEKILTLRFATALILSIGLAAISAFVLSSDYAQELADYSTRSQLHDETSSDATIIVDRRPSPLAAMFHGIAKDSAASVHLSTDTHPDPSETIDDNPFSVLFPTVDLTFIIGMVMSLLAVLFAYDSVSGEREAGTLALISSNPVKKPMLIFGKWVGGYLSLIIPCSVGLLTGLIIVSLHPMIQFTSADWGAFGLIVLGALVYLSCFFALSVLVSALTRRSSTAVLALLFLWALSVFIIPNLSPSVAKAVYRIPSFVAQERQTNLAVIELELERQKEHEKNALEVMDKRLWWDSGGELIQDTEQRFINAKRETLSKSASDYRRKLRKQEKIAAGIASLSPYASFALFAARLAATDLGSEDKFIHAAERFYNEYFQGTSVISVSGRKRDEKLAFSYTEPTVGERLKSGFAPFCILLLFTALFLMGGYVIFLRSNVK